MAWLARAESVETDYDVCHVSFSCSPLSLFVLNATTENKWLNGRLETYYPAIGTIAAGLDHQLEYTFLP
jgi:hypothetical protein